MRSDLLSALTERPPPSDLKCTLFALSARLSGLGIRIPSKTADNELQSSLLIASPLKNHILDQDREYGWDIIAEQLQNKASTSRQNRERSAWGADDLYSQLPDSLQRAVDLARERGSFTWLTALPFTDHGFTLHRSDYHDSMDLWYGWTASKLPTKCECSNNLAVEHALS